MTVVSRDGHDISGATANKPTNMEPGMLFYDTTTATLLVCNSVGTLVSVNGENVVVTVAAAGTTQGTAAVLAGNSLNKVTGASGTNGVVLPAAAVGVITEVWNQGTSALLVYPAGTNTINGGSGGASVSVAAGAAVRLTSAATDWTLYTSTIAAQVALPVVAVAAAGSTQGGAAALSQVSMNVVTAADGVKGVVLPTGATDGNVEVYNNSASALLVYPGSTNTINGGSASVAVTVKANSLSRFYGTSSTNWGAHLPLQDAGAIVVDSVTSGASTLPVTGQAAAQGGSATLTGGASSTSGNAGGAAAMLGGAGGLTGIGGACTVTGAAGGATSGAGGACTRTGGAGTNGNAAGGAITDVGGAGQGSAAGGVITQTGGAGGATGAGGALTFTGGAGGASSGAGGAVVTVGGAGTNSNAVGGAVTGTGGAGHGSSAGGAGTLTGGAGGLTGAGGAITITSGAGGGTSGAAGAIAISVGSCTNGNGAAVTITAGTGVTGTASGGNVNLVAGAAASTGVPGEIQVNADSNLMMVQVALTATDASRVVVIAPRAMRFKSVNYMHTTGSTSGTLQIEKLTGTTAAGSGTTLLTGTIDLSATTVANTSTAGTLIATVASLTFAAGDRASIKIAGTMTSLAGAVATLCFAPC